MSLEITNESAICFKCGTKYSRRKGYFPVSYSLLNKGVGYTPVCKDCIDSLYNSYLSQCKDAKLSVRQVCRKLDLYWSDKVYDIVSRKSTTRTMMTQYIAKINTITYVGKSYDDTLSEEGTLWSFTPKDEVVEENLIVSTNNNDDNQETEIPDEVIAFWGSGYTPAMYEELERKRKYWMSKIKDSGTDSDLDIGTEVYIKQICALELDINRDRAAGKSVDKNVNALNTLLGSANLKPVQRNQEDLDTSVTNTPMGVWLYRYENQRPLPEIDDDLKDVNKLRKYVFTWMGHLCKMLNIKNAYTQLYEDEIARLRVEKPEYDGDDDEAFMTELMTESPPGSLGVE